MRHMFGDGLSPPAWVTHLVLRGTFLPDTVRCSAGDLFRRPSYLSDEFDFGVDPRGIKCYIDVRSNAYLIGAGPSTLTVLMFHHLYWDGEYALDAGEGETEQDVIEEVRQRYEARFSYLFGREHFMFLGPNVDFSSEAWRFLGYWDVQRREDGTVLAIHPERDLWRRLRPNGYREHLAGLEMEMPDFREAVLAANQARVSEYGGRIGADPSLPMLLTDVHDLREYYVNVGAYDDPDSPPAQPPPVPGEGMRR